MVMPWVLSRLSLRNAGFLLLMVLNSACNAGAGLDARGDVSHPSFSADGKSLLFDFCKGAECDLVAYSIEGKRFSRIVPVDEEFRFSGASMANRPTVLASILRYRKEGVTSYPQIALIDLDSNTYRRITNDPSHKYGPSLSFDGERVAYIQSHRQRAWFNGDPRATGWDIQVLDIASRENTRATNYCFYALSKPFFAQDNGDLVFSGEGPMCNYPESGAESGKRDYKEYRDRFGEDNIVRFGPMRKRLEPWFRTQGAHANSPHVARNGDVLFVSRTNQTDGIKKGYYNYDLFLRQGEQIRRLTWLKSMINGAALAPNSEFAAYISDPQRNHQRSLWLLNIATGEHQQISLVQLSSEIEGLSVRRIAEER